VVTKNEADRGAFETPMLRDVTKHPPYLHDGSVTTLREVVELEGEAYQDTALTAFPQ
jgi:cytochrome c peroxidase